MARKLAAFIAALVLGLTTVGSATAQVAPAPGDDVPAVSAPSGPTDETKVPHYFGPYPNWALSPLTTADVTVEILGDGTGATAMATVGPTER